jgi:hypothetical protein
MSYIHKDVKTQLIVFFNIGEKVLQPKGRIKAFNKTSDSRLFECIQRHSWFSAIIKCSKGITFPTVVCLGFPVKYSQTF